MELAVAVDGDAGAGAGDDLGKYSNINTCDEEELLADDFGRMANLRGGARLTKRSDCMICEYLYFAIGGVCCCLKEGTFYHNLLIFCVTSAKNCAANPGLSRSASSNAFFNAEYAFCDCEVVADDFN